MIKRASILAFLTFFLCLLFAYASEGHAAAARWGEAASARKAVQEETAGSFADGPERRRDPGRAPEGGPQPWGDAVAGYLRGLSRPDGGFGWADQPDSHLTPTFAAIGSYHLLGLDVPDRKKRASYVRTHHPLFGERSEVGYSSNERRSFTYQQIQSLQWMGEDASAFRQRVRGWIQPFAFPRYYELGGNPIFRQVVMALVCRELLGLSVDAIAPRMEAYVSARQRADGSFNNTLAADGSGGHVLNTLWAVRAVHLLGRTDSLTEQTVAWLQEAQFPGGGFTHRPDPDVGKVDDVMYTWAAVQALGELSATPADREGCIRYLLSLWNADGGFGDRPDLPSRPMATYYALDALKALGALDRLSAQYFRTSVSSEPAPEPLPEGLHPYTIQLEAQGNGSPIEAVALAQALKIHLWGAKNADSAWVATAQAVADRRAVPVTFFPSNEEYGLYVRLAGVGTYSHLSDPIGPPASGTLMRRMYPGRFQEKVFSWPAFKARRIAPLEEAGGRMVSQVLSNSVLTRLLMDDSIEEETGYAAISTFHHSQNFAYLWPYLFRYRHEIPFVALQDAHGGEAWWWADDLASYRTVFLAREPTWEGWLRALEENWVVAIRHDDLINFRTRIQGGAPGVQAFVRQHEAKWKWWADHPEEIQRPWVSVVAVTPDDRFEDARPERGVTVRVRCWWHGRREREEQVVELVALSIDGERVVPTLVEERSDEGELISVYHTYHLPASAPGNHKATAVVRKQESGEERTSTMRFEVAN